MRSGQASLCAPQHNPAALLGDPRAEAFWSTRDKRWPHPNLPVAAEAKGRASPEDDTILPWMEKASASRQSVSGNPRPPLTLRLRCLALFWCGCVGVVGVAPLLSSTFEVSRCRSGQPPSGRPVVHRLGGYSPTNRPPWCSLLPAPKQDDRFCSVWERGMNSQPGHGLREGTMW